MTGLPKRRWTRALLAASCFAAALSVAQPGRATLEQAAPASGTKLGYDIYAGGLKAMRTELAVDLGQEDYRLHLKAYFQGFISNFFSLDFSVVAEGALEEGRVRPRDYEMNSLWQERSERRIAMSFDQGEITQLEIEPEDRRPTADAVPAEERFGALDPISALLWPVVTLLQEQTCEGERQVFDGRKLFALRLEQQEPVTLRTSGYSPYGGPTQVCHLFIEQTAGPKKERSRNRIPKYIRVYLAPLSPGGPPLPLRLEADNRLGRIVMHLTDVEGALSAEQLSRRPAQ